MGGDGDLRSHSRCPVREDPKIAPFATSVSLDQFLKRCWPFIQGHSALPGIQRPPSTLVSGRRSEPGSSCTTRQGNDSCHEQRSTFTVPHHHHRDRSPSCIIPQQRSDSRPLLTPQLHLPRLCQLRSICHRGSPSVQLSTTAANRY